MKSYVTVKGSTLTVHLPEELDHHVADQMREEVDPILEKTPIREVFFDFQETVFCDSSGIGLLMGRYRKMRQLGGKVVAVNVDSQMKRLLMLSGIHKLIQIQEGRSHGR